MRKSFFEGILVVTQRRDISKGTRVADLVGSALAFRGTRGKVNPLFDC